ncbi:hypothetical protein KUL42_32550 [Alteromonas sp. KUL42]|uniref:head-tail connector protein n=1 Tax=Alteromonas sp. KUL42 TaxID=2480797 RepID=UPI001036D307|nr:head-tail connector protein [Alteromonas sp. KUL42]TAP33275.1 phage gp6-like head-tail connector protein [Alteromonas sp. KUL42]GEA08494.1 hypothetical protein KUL42_32550 [Alteromonas sp. KUL42]
MPSFNFITLEEAQRQLGVDASDVDTDEEFDSGELNDFIEDATAIVASEINRQVYETQADLDAAILDGSAPEYAISLETPHKGRIVKRLTKLLVAHMFKHREITSDENARAVFMTYGHALTQVQIPS